MARVKRKVDENVEILRPCRHVLYFVLRDLLPDRAKLALARLLVWARAVVLWRRSLQYFFILRATLCFCAAVIGFRFHVIGFRCDLRLGVAAKTCC
jgi:hypothetical protein